MSLGPNIGKLVSSTRKVKKTEVAGPYRSQSSVPKVRAASTKTEHRKVRVSSSLATPSRRGRPATSSALRAPSLERTFKQAERQAAVVVRQKQRAQQSERKALRTLKRVARTIPPDPHVAIDQARQGGVAMNESQRKAFKVLHGDKALEKVEKARIEHIAEHEGLKEDPAAEFAISTAATLGLGAGAKLAGSGVEALGAKLASTEATVGEKAVEGGLKAALKRGAARKVEDVRTAPARAVRSVRTAPERAVKSAKEAPTKVKRAATTSEGRRGAAAATAKSARRHPVRSGYGAAAASPVPLPGELDKRARAFAEGSAKAVVGHPGETLKTTARSIPAAITAPAALLAAAGSSVIHGTPAPLEKTASEQAKGVGHIVSQAFSGDVSKAEQAARKEGSLALLTPLPAISRLSRYERARSGLREAAASVRSKLAQKGEATNRSVRHAPKGVEQNVFGATARHEARKRTALIKQRADNPHRVSASHHERAITKAIAKAPKGSHVALQTFAEYGVRDSKGAALLRQHGPGDAQLVKALDYADKHPEIFKSKDFAQALAAVDRASKTAPAALVGKGERARLMQQGDLFGHTRPEHMVPGAAKAFTSATTREGAWADLASADKQLQALKRQGRERFNQAKVLKGAERQRVLEEGRARYTQARKLLAQNRKLYKALDPFVHPGRSIDRSKLKPYDSRMLADYKRTVEASRKEAGLAPAIWTHHTEANTAGRGTGMENRFPTNAGRVEHMREGNLAKADNLDRSLEGVIRGTVHMPRLRAAGKQFGRDFVQHFKTPFKIDSKEKVVGQGSKDWTAITAPRTKDNPNGGQFDPKSWARFPVREWKNAVKDPFSEPSVLVSLLDNAERGKVKGSEPWVLMPREAIKEARAQISPEHNILTTGANKAARVASRTILGTNPAWAIAQVAAEGIPQLLAHPELLNPGKLASLERDITRYRKSHPEEAAAMQATVGASPLNAAVNRTPLDLQETYTPALWDKGAKGLTRGKTARSALSLVKLRALGEFDVRRQNEYRTVLAAAEADKRFRSWHTALTGLFDSQRRISHDFRGKSREEMWNWLNKDPKGKIERAKIADYVDNIQGNWTAFSRYERSLAPFTIFYPFLRYSLRWTLWTFPKTHPLTATIAYMLGQANSNQLEKLVGGPLSNPIAYAYPVYSGAGKGKALLPGGSRISPGQSSLTQSLASGNPAQVLSSANPFLGAGITALTGTEPLSGETSSLPRGEAAINQLLAMPAPLRLAGIKLGGQSVASKAFAQFDPSKSKRSLLFPFIPLSADRFKASEKLGKAFARKYGEGHVPGPFDSKLVQDLLFGSPSGGPQPHLLPKVLQKIHASEAAGDITKVAEQPFYGKSKAFSAQQKKLLEAVENAWQTRPKSQPKGQGIGGSAGGGIGGYSLGTAPIGSPASSGGIGGHPIGGKIGGAG